MCLSHVYYDAIIAMNDRIFSQQQEIFQINSNSNKCLTNGALSQFY